MERREYRYQEVIFREKDYQLCMYSICEGSVNIFSGFGSPEEGKLATLTKGQIFGQIGMIGMIPRTATALAAEDNVVLEIIGMEDLADYLKNNPENLQPIMCSVSARIRELTENLAQVVQMTNEAVRSRENGDIVGQWLTEGVRALADRLKGNGLDAGAFFAQKKRKKALSGGEPAVVEYGTGSVIFRAGEEADCMYEIYHGSVGIYSNHGKTGEKLLTTLNAGSVFGEMGVLEEMPRSATAVCLEDCSVLVVDPDHFMQFFQSKPYKMLEILRHMCMRLRELTGTYLEVRQALEDISGSQEDFVWAKLEQIRQCNLGISVYGDCVPSDWMYI